MTTPSASSTAIPASELDEFPNMKKHDFRPNVWMCSCRTRMRDFNERTLIFRPDIGLSLIISKGKADMTLYCHNGKNCKIQTEAHQKLYNHDYDPNVKVQFAKPTDDNPYGIPNVERTTSRQIHRTWNLEPEKEKYPRNRDGNNLALQYSYFTDLPFDSKVVIYVHGFRQKFYQITGALDHLDKIANFNSLDGSEKSSLSFKDNVSYTNFGVTSNKVQIFGFMWPCHSKRFAYTAARNKVTGAAKVLYKLIEFLKTRNNEVVLIGHSLGARVSLTALSRNGNDSEETDNNVVLDKLLKEEGRIISAFADPASEPVKVSSLFLIGAAVGCDCFENENEFSLDSLNVQGKIFTFNSLKDEVLADYFKTGEKFAKLLGGQLFCGNSKTAKALGLVGASNKDRNANIDLSSILNKNKLNSIDVTKEVPSHTAHSYFMASEFVWNLRKALKIDAVDVPRDFDDCIEKIGFIENEDFTEEDDKELENLQFSLDELLKAADGDEEVEKMVWELFGQENGEGKRSSKADSLKFSSFLAQNKDLKEFLMENELL